ncbi:MAG TPA: endonuclease III [Anaerolineaceae bacterium]|nr:endonuclease III [Anaerolineaceae bacterium]
MEKRPFDIDDIFARIRAAVAKYPKAAMFELAEEGFGNLFEQIIACIISIRTYDEETIPIARRLFTRARTPEEIAGLSTEEIDRLISPSTFHERKAVQIREIARRAMSEYGGSLPCDRDVLLSFPGVGIKCANLALGVACEQTYISVDIHVHRVTNRWGFVATPTPERTTRALEAKVPTEYWIEINRLLVPFGKHICTGTLPRCSTCPVLEYCRQVGVTKSR